MIPSTQGEDKETAPETTAAEPAPADLAPTLPQQSHARAEAAARSNTPPQPAATLRRTPERIDRYEIVRPLGRGGMGEVYLAYDPLLERHVALKAPHGESGACLADRFTEESRCAARLRHPNLCPVYDAGQFDGAPFLAMAYIEGRPLTVAFPPPLSGVQAADLVRRLALALHEAHTQGVVHRDLKPSNILVTARGEPVVVDFGLARRDDVRTTLPGQVMGTPAYMAPEQAVGRVDEIGPQSDLYSLGVVLYELLTGRLPFEGSVGERIARLLSEDAPPPSRWRADLDARLEAVRLRAVARRREDRFATMAEFAEALAVWGDDAGRPPAAPPAARPAESMLDPRAAQDVLALLREWGWERALAKIKTDIATAEGPRKEALRVLLGWLAGERGHYDEAAGHFRAAESAPGLSGWALAGQAVVALRERRLSAAHELLDRVAPTSAGDAGLRATVAHLRGAVALHERRHAEALTWLHEALEGIAPRPTEERGSEALGFGAGRVLDTLGMVHAARNNFPAASAFYAESLTVKKRHGDDAGLALTQGQLGRLMLDWDRLDEADAYFRDGLAIARRIGDERGEAVLYNQRGRVLLARGRPAEAKPFLEEAVRAASGRWSGVEAHARKDLALAWLGVGGIEEAEAEARRAEALFQSFSTAEGIFHVQAVWGAIRRAQGRPAEAARRFEDAAGGFERQGEHADSARTLRELGRTHREPALAVQALLAALDEAERGRRDHLRGPIERDLREASELDWARRELRRRTPPGVEEREETATVIAAEVRAAGGEEDLSNLMQIRNNLDADLAAALAEQGAVVLQRRGEGFLALVRGAGHARRGVAAVLGVARFLAEGNRPRRVLGWPLWRLYAGVASGPVCVGEVGPWDRPEWTAAGPAVRQADELRQASGPEAPCVSDEVRRLAAAAAFTFRSKGPQVWEVAGAIEGVTS